MPAGRPNKRINWDDVDKFLVAGCSGVQVAASLGIHRDTLYDRCEKKFGKKFSEYSAEKKQKGNSLLLGKQFHVAMSGNTTMLVWLGKQRLGQEENPKENSDFNGSLRELLNELKNIKKPKEEDNGRGHSTNKQDD